MRQGTLTLKSHRFRMEREADWRRLEEILDIIERGSRHELTDTEIIQLPVLYRAALSSLSTARATSLDQSLIAYLSALSTRAYFCVYGPRSRFLERIWNFFWRDWPAAVRALRRPALVSLVLMLVGAVAAFFLTKASPDWYYAFIPSELAHGREPGATAQYLRDGLFRTRSASGLGFFASFLFSHNAQVAIFAFALGFACCLPTAYLMLTNGFMLGAMFALYGEHGLGVELGGWLFIHGATELFAITLAGAAGFHLGWNLIFPGDDTRLAALAKAGRTSAIVMIGVVVMLFCAGLLEGYGRQLITSTVARYAVAVTSAALWLGYFYGFGFLTRRGHGGG